MNISRIAVALSQNFKNWRAQQIRKISLSMAPDRIALHVTISKSQSACQNSQKIVVETDD